MVKETVVERVENDDDLMANLTKTVRTLNKLSEEALKRDISVEIGMATKSEAGISVPVFALRGAWKQLVKKLILTL